MNIAKCIDVFNEWVGRIFSWAIILLTLLAVLEVIERVVFNSPSLWGFEVTTQIFGLYFMIIAGYGLLYNSHVSIDVVTYYLSPKTRTIVDIVAYFLFFFPFTLICIWEGYGFAAKSWSVMETSMSVWGGPVYPIKTVILVAFILLFLQGVSEVIKKVISLKGGKASC
jgi:TRAP-type mannitol/chloroaromatic compound transport system permease small subunit